MKFKRGDRVRVDKKSPWYATNDDIYVILSSYDYDDEYEPIKVTRYVMVPEEYANNHYDADDLETMTENNLIKVVTPDEVFKQIICDSK